MMMGFGLLFMLAFLAFPVLLIAGLIIWMMRTTSQQNIPQPPAVNAPTVSPPKVASLAPSSDVRGACSHCGAGLQPEWSHCPQCGAPTG